MRIGIDLLYIRPGVNGGTESYIRNLLDGFYKYSSGSNVYILFTARDNAKTFTKYTKKSNFVICNCPISSANVNKRLLWENLNLDKLGIEQNLDIWFIPVYSMPLITSKKIPYVVAIMDLISLHYPNNFTLFRRLFFKLCWKNDCRNAAKVVTISDFCKKDIIDHFRLPPEKVQRIYCPVKASKTGVEFNALAESYKIADREYFYTVAQLSKNKNLITLLKAVRLLKNDNDPVRLVISGSEIASDIVDELDAYIKANDIEDAVIRTGFIDNDKRDCLYDHCKAFLFPSVFEGFGMPPVEAMKRGVPVITTRETAIYEVTQGKAEYVYNAYDEKEWAEKMKAVKSDRVDTKIDVTRYDLKNIVDQYNDLFCKIARRETFERQKKYDKK